MKMFLLLQVLLGGQFEAPPVVKLPLTNVQVIVDPGHGGINTGVRYRFMDGKEKKLFVEKVYTCDVSARLIKILQNLGARVVSTITGPCLDHPQNNLFSKMVRDNKQDEFFTTTGEVVRSDSSGLMERVHLAEQATRLHPFDRTIYISIHFDSAFSSQKRGAYFIVPRRKTSSPLAISLAKEFDSAGLEQRFCKRAVPIIAIGTCGIKNILILKNAPVADMVLLELGNVGNSKERMWILNPDNREKYATTIAKGIVRFNKDD
jgi:N-acetylmuramoyl-L-alanine amidase